MNKSVERLMGFNALVLSLATLASFVLPLILDPMLEGRGNFVKAMAQVFPLLLIIPFSCNLIKVASYQGTLGTSETSPAETP